MTIPEYKIAVPISERCVGPGCQQRALKDGLCRQHLTQRRDHPGRELRVLAPRGRPRTTSVLLERVSGFRVEPWMLEQARIEAEARRQTIGEVLRGWVGAGAAAAKEARVRAEVRAQAAAFAAADAAASLGPKK